MNAIYSFGVSTLPRVAKTLICALLVPCDKEEKLYSNFLSTSSNFMSTSSIAKNDLLSVTLDLGENKMEKNKSNVHAT